MNSKDIRKQLLGAGSALRVLAMVGAGAAATGIAITPAAAQDYTSGSVSGTVTDEAGNPVSGATVELTSTDQGFDRTVTTAASGTFRIVSLPTGNYDIVVNAPGLDTFTATNVRVLASQTASLSIGMTTTGNEIVVSASTIQADFSGTTTGLAVDLEDLVKTVPISRDLTSVILLAPGTTQGDSAFGNLASIGGSSVAENAYYLNGLNITNFDNYLGSARVPFEFYSSVEVKSGGYPAEFGRATGGIVSAVSKSGSNEFSAAMHLNWEPNFLQSQGKNLENSDGPTRNRSQDTDSSYSAILEASGPIIKDRLFVYGLLELRDEKSLVAYPQSGIARYTEQDNPFWAVKVDAFPIDSQHLEFTIFDTKRTSVVTDKDYNENNGVPTIGSELNTTENNFGGVNYVAKYTGTFTDWLTLSAAYGKMRDRFDTVIGSTEAYVRNLNTDEDAVFGVPYGGYYTNQTASSVQEPYRTEREFYRADADLYFSLFGDHHVRLGFDTEKNTLEHSSVRTGGDFLLANGFITQEAYDLGNGGAGIAIILRPDNEVELNYFNSGGSFESTNKAYYIQDEWSVTDRLTLNLGLRRDDFTINRADGLPLADLDENYAPRLGFSYELFPDHSGKVFGFFGQYYLPIASNTAFRQAGSEYYWQERYTLEGIDNNGLPILGAQITDDGSYQSACPVNISPMSSGNFCSVTGNGTVPDTTQAIAANLKATRESEFILGYEHRFTTDMFGDFTVGLTYTHRKLDRTAEDSAIDAGVIAWCEANGITGCEDTWTGYHQYVINNPGKDIVVNLLGQDGQQVTLKADELGYGDAIRKYDAIELTFNRPWDGKWRLGGSYTWSDSRGNSEGYVQSDFDQDDAGITQDFDQPGFVDYSYGKLPNHRRHRFKLFGSYAITEPFIIGTNISIDSPRPLSCFGFHPTDVFANGYDQASHYCGLEPSPRGTAQKSDWIYNVDMSARYNIEIPTGQIATLRFDVFNIFNSQAVNARNEIGDASATYDPDTGLPVSVTADPNYGYATGYQAPRTVRLGLDISF